MCVAVDKDNRLVIQRLRFSSPAVSNLLCFWDKALYHTYSMVRKSQKWWSCAADEQPCCTFMFRKEQGIIPGLHLYSQYIMSYRTRTLAFISRIGLCQVSSVNCIKYGECVSFSLLFNYFLQDTIQESWGALLHKQFQISSKCIELPFRFYYPPRSTAFLTTILIG